METKKLLQLRKDSKKRKPHFVVRESHIYPRIKKHWKFPYGTSSAIRQRKRGEPALVSIGYGSPKAVRGLHSSGLEFVLVNNVKELLAIKSKTQGAVIASGLGNRKRIEMLQAAKKNEIKVLNVKNVDLLIIKISSGFDARKKARSDRMTQKNKKLEEKKKTAEEKKKKEEQEKKTESTTETAPAEAKAEKVKEEQQEQKEAIDKTIIKRQ